MVYAQPCNIISERAAPEEFDMIQDSSRNAWRRFLPLLIGSLVVAAVIGIPAGRGLMARFFRSLRMQKVQAINVNLSPFTDPSANPALHQMIAQMISDDVVVAANDPDQPAANAAAASQLSGFNVSLLTDRQDPPKFVVLGHQAFDMTLNRARLQSVFSQAGHPEISVPQALDGAPVKVEIPRAVELQYGRCPTPASATQALANNIGGPAPSSTEYSDCVRLREGPNPVMSFPPGVDFQQLAKIALEVAGMNSSQAQEFLGNVNWQATLVMAVPRFLRSYEAVKISGAKGTLLSMAGRRGPGYALLWANEGTGYMLTGFGDSSHAVQLAESVKSEPPSRGTP